MNVALTIKNAEVERLAAEVARLAGETKTQAIKVALLERRGRLATGVDPEARRAELLRWLEDDVWARVPPELRGRPHDSRADDEIMGYGPDGLPGHDRLLGHDRLPGHEPRPGHDPLPG
jgi:antitoxin VapB